MTGFDPIAAAERGYTVTQASAIILAGVALAILVWLVLDYRHMRRVLRSPAPHQCRENCDTYTACPWPDGPCNGRDVSCRYNDHVTRK